MITVIPQIDSIVSALPTMGLTAYHQLTGFLKRYFNKTIQVAKFAVMAGVVLMFVGMVAQFFSEPEDGMYIIGQGLKTAATIISGFAFAYAWVRYKALIEGVGFAEQKIDQLIQIASAPLPGPTVELKEWFTPSRNKVISKAPAALIAAWMIFSVLMSTFEYTVHHYFTILSLVLFLALSKIGYPEFVSSWLDRFLKLTQVFGVILLLCYVLAPMFPGIKDGIGYYVGKTQHSWGNQMKNRADADERNNGREDAGEQLKEGVVSAAARIAKAEAERYMILMEDEWKKCTEEKCDENSARYQRMMDAQKKAEAATERYNKEIEKNNPKDKRPYTQQLAEAKPKELIPNMVWTVFLWTLPVLILGGIAYGVVTKGGGIIEAGKQVFAAAIIIGLIYGLVEFYYIARHQVGRNIARAEAKEDIAFGRALAAKTGVQSDTTTLHAKQAKVLLGYLEPRETIRIRPQVQGAILFSPDFAPAPVWGTDEDGGVGFTVPQAPRYALYFEWQDREGKHIGVLGQPDPNGKMEDLVIHNSTEAKMALWFGYNGERGNFFQYDGQVTVSWTATR